MFTHKGQFDLVWSLIFHLCVWLKLEVDPAIVFNWYEPIKKKFCSQLSFCRFLIILVINKATLNSRIYFLSRLYYAVNSRKLEILKWHVFCWNGTISFYYNVMEALIKKKENSLMVKVFQSQPKTGLCDKYEFSWTQELIPNEIQIVNCSESLYWIIYFSKVTLCCVLYICKKKFVN